MPIFFANESPTRFDFLAAAFYLITRYEEYLPHHLDAYGRYAHTNSVAFKNGFLHRPLVNEWLVDLKQKLRLVFPEITFAQKQFTYTPTYDIDLAWSYAHKGFWRNAAGFAKQIFGAKFSAASERINVCMNGVKDPFDVFEDLQKLHQQFGLHPIWFFLAAKKNKGVDRNILPYKKALQQLISNLSANDKIGVHLSWQAAHSTEIMGEETVLMASFSKAPIVANRYHFLKFALPTGYERITHFSDDYSMGYGSINGFRASTCTPYLWYNLATETQTTLMVYPFAYMDANSIFEQKDTAETALTELQNLHDVVKKVDGNLITIFHNHLMGRSHVGRTWWHLNERFLLRNF